MAEDKKESAPAAEETKAVAVQEAKSGEVAQFDDFLSEDGGGHEDFDQSDFTVPYIGILQALSKPLQKNHDKYVKGAEQGNLINSATREVYNAEEEGLIVIPTAFQHRYVAWKPDNGGIAHDYGSDSTKYDSIEPNDKYKRIDEDGNELIDSMEYFVLIVDRKTGSFNAAVIPFSSIFSKKAKRWNNLIRAHTEMKNGKPVKPPIYFYAYEVKTVPESNEKGAWYSWDISDYAKTPELPMGRELFEAAKQLRASVTSGELRAATEDPADAAPGSSNDGDGDGAF